MQQTPIYNLNIPEQEDYYNVDDFNENSEIIETVLAEHDGSINTINSSLTTIEGNISSVNSTLNNFMERFIITDDDIGEGVPLATGNIVFVYA
jgi:hypothetical protein